jgi:hypothetical protein
MQFLFTRGYKGALFPPQATEGLYPHHRLQRCFIPTTGYKSALSPPQATKVLYPHHRLQRCFIPTTGYKGALSPPLFNSPLAYLIKFSFVCIDNESMFIPAASVKAPPNPQIFWYLAVRFSVKTIPVETTDTMIALPCKSSQQ